MKEWADGLRAWPPPEQRHRIVTLIIDSRDSLAEGFIFR